MSFGNRILGPLAMLRVLVAKDLRRTRRNPLPWVINLIVPLMMTALLGLVFGGGNNQSLGRIRFAVVDEDRSALSDILRGAGNQGRAGDHLDPVFMDRAAAMEQVNAGKISAVLIIETNFTRNYLTGRAPVSLELIKNPAESISPAVLEELLGAAVAGLNVISRNFNSEFPEWERVVEGKEDYHLVATLIDRAGDKIKAAKQFVDPPLVSYQKEGSTNDVAAAGAGAGKTGTNGGATVQEGLAAVFSYLLVGMSAMFLLFLGQNGLTDLHRELRLRTFERYQTMHQPVWPFIASKIIFTVVMLLICSAIMLIGGGLAFGIHWRSPLALVALMAAYSCFVAALFAVLVALVPDERRAAALNNIVGMGLGLVGGCAFPPRQFPEFLREHVTPLMPTYWLVDTARSLQSSDGLVPWAWAGLKLLACAGVLVLLTGILFRRKFQLGQRV